MEYETSQSIQSCCPRTRIRSKRCTIRNCRLVKVNTPFTMKPARLLDANRIPVYNGDLEENVPSSVLEFKKTIAGAHGIITCTPEYNYSFGAPCFSGRLIVVCLVR
jgi:NAD(P)H-dependent FMN reductase